MPAKTDHRLRIGFFVLATLLTLVRAAEAPHPLMGATRDQVLQKLGGPKSQLEAGSRNVLLYQNERIVLRDNLVVEVEPLASSAVRPAPASSAEVPPPTGAVSPSRISDAGRTAGVAPVSSQATVAPLETAALQASANEPKVEIKLVRPPSANYTRPIGSAQEANPAPTPLPVAVTPVPVPPAAPPVVRPVQTQSAPAPAVEPAVAPKQEPAVKILDDTGGQQARRENQATEQAKSEKLAAETAAKEMKAKAIEATRRRLNDANARGAEESPLSPMLLLGIAAVVLGGFGFLIWRWRQRRIELAATSVQNTPVAPGGGAVAVSLAAGSTFNDDYLSQLDSGRFEILVAAYFNKTGVVASRSKAGQGTVAQIRISWKGEPKPFAGVWCIAAPEGAIEAEALRPMLAELETDQIRRGQVVTTGIFTAGAKQFAAEKHLTLLSGEAFLEKLNALPESARKDIHNSVLAGQNVLST